MSVVEPFSKRENIVKLHSWNGTKDIHIWWISQTLDDLVEVFWAINASIVSVHLVTQMKHQIITENYHLQMRHFMILLWKSNKKWYLMTLLLCVKACSNCRLYEHVQSHFCNTHHSIVSSMTALLKWISWTALICLVYF